MKKEIKKIIKDGKVAVAISPGFGAGWTTWENEISPFEPKVIEMILAGKQLEITKEWCKLNLGIDNVYCGGVEDLEVVWIDEGRKFSINEYDGNESLYIDKELDFEA